MPAAYRRRMAGRLAARAKANAGRVIALVLVVGVFAFVLPRVADYGDVWDAVDRPEHGAASPRSSSRRSINLATFGPPWMAALPGLSFLHALVMSQASTAAASVLPGGDAVGMGLSYAMLRRWGFTVEQVTVGDGRDGGLERVRERRLRGRGGGSAGRRAASRTRS